MEGVYQNHDTVFVILKLPVFQLLWSGLYQRWQRHAIVQQDLWEEIGIVKEQDKALQSKAIKLRK